MTFRRLAAVALSTALAVPLIALTASPAIAAPVCSSGDGKTCYWSGQNLTGSRETHSTLRNACIHLSDFAARSAWNQSGYKLTVYETASCGGHYQSVASGGKINRPTWTIGSFKLT
ncbi:peptidase inhibitor family I36 protein [Streptomyces sp. NPDC058398]|uniref:peptidase inhibitor family I36 protein n=1 Tax=Streptomyces sp. NPDC058398 TaxID=3346479 RepID=UPI0036490A5F